MIQTSFNTLDFDYIFHLYTCKKATRAAAVAIAAAAAALENDGRETESANISENVGEPKPAIQTDRQTGPASATQPTTEAQNALNSDGKG